MVSTTPGNSNRNKWLVGCLGGCGLLSILCVISVVAFFAWAGNLGDVGVLGGNELSQNTQDYLKHNNLLNSSEKVLVYYDASTANDRSEISMVTSDRVVYWNNGQLTTIRLKDVKDVQHSSSALGDIIEVWGEPSSYLKIEIALWNDGDVFYRALQNAVQAARNQK